MKLHWAKSTTYNCINTLRENGMEMESLTRIWTFLSSFLDLSPMINSVRGIESELYRENGELSALSDIIRESRVVISLSFQKEKNVVSCIKYLKENRMTRLLCSEFESRKFRFCFLSVGNLMGKHAVMIKSWRKSCTNIQRMCCSVYYTP